MTLGGGSNCVRECSPKRNYGRFAKYSSRRESPRNDDLVVGVDARRRIRVLETLLGVANRQDVDAVAAAQVKLLQRKAVHLRGWTQLP